MLKIYSERSVLFYSRSRWLTSDTPNFSEKSRKEVKSILFGKKSDWNIQKAAKELKNSVESDYYIFRKISDSKVSPEDLEDIITEIRRKSINLSQHTLGILIEETQDKHEKESILSEFGTHENIDSSIVFSVLVTRDYFEMLDILEKYDLHKYVDAKILSLIIKYSPSFEDGENILHDFSGGLDDFTVLMLGEHLCATQLINRRCLKGFDAEKYGFGVLFEVSQDFKGIEQILDSSLPFKIKLLAYITALNYYFDDMVDSPTVQSFGEIFNNPMIPEKMINFGSDFFLNEYFSTSDEGFNIFDFLKN